jgi:sarcosine oxidase, subunit beta
VNDRRDPGHVLIIGGGIQGLATAYHLAAGGARRVEVVDAGYFQGGASGRNGTLIRGGFSSPEWTRLFALSVHLWQGLSRTLGENTMFTRRGYMIVAHESATADRFAEMAGLHREHRLRSEPLSPVGAAAREPALDTGTIAGALDLGDGGVAPHHAVMKAYLTAARKRGAVVRYGAALESFEVSDGRVTHATVSGERQPCDLLVIAAGAYSPEVAGLGGADMPGFAMRIEAMALEPVRPLIRRAIALPDRLCYLHQTARGEIVGGAEVAEAPQVTLASDLPTLAATARAYVETFPATGRLRILRHWAGMLHATPDWGPLLGPHPRIDNLWMTAGWSYGFAGAPAAGHLLARAILEGTLPEELAPFLPDRFERGEPVREGAIVLAPVQ